MVSFRPVEVRDVEPLLELRAALFDVGDARRAEAGWMGACRQILLDGLATGDITGVVALADDGRAVGCALARVHRWLPGPTNPTGLTGYIGSWSTAPTADRDRTATEVLKRLVELLSARGVTEIVVHANEATVELAQSLGFAENLNTIELTRVTPSPQ